MPSEPRGTTLGPVSRTGQESPRYDFAPDATPGTLRSWFVERMQGRDPAYGFGREDEGIEAPHLLPAAFYRSGSAELRQAFRDDIVVRLLRDTARSEADPPDDVVRHLLRMLLNRPIYAARLPLAELVEWEALQTRPEGEDLQDLALAALGAMGHGDVAFWTTRVAQEPRPGTVQAAIRALGRRDVTEALKCLAALGPGYAHAGQAIVALLLAMLEWWLEQDAARDERGFLREVEGLPAELLEPMRPVLAALRQRHGLPKPDRDLTDQIIRAYGEVTDRIPSSTWRSP